MPTKVTPTPRLLIGAALLFWGAMTDHAILGLLACLLIEGANWIRLRWDFQKTAYALAWRICILLIFVSGALIWLDGERHTALSHVMLWLPILLLPLQFVQSYGLNRSMPLSVFFIFQKQRNARHLHLGLVDTSPPFHFGNAYFVIALFSAGLGVHAQQISFVVGFIVLAGCFIFHRVKARPYVVFTLLLVAAGLGFAGQKGMQKLYQWATGYGSESRYSTDSNANRTSIGSLGKIKQSPEILWRLRITEGFKAPRLLQLASYNRYLGPIWNNQIPQELLADYPIGSEKFNGLISRDSSAGEAHFLLREMTEEELSSRLPSFQLRGAIRDEEPLPLPGDAASLTAFDLDDAESNPLGSIRVSPKRAIIESTVRWGDSMPSEGSAWLPEDSEIPLIEIETIQSISAELGLEQLPSASAKAARIAAWFASEFTYTRHLSIPQNHQTKPSALSLFLTTQRRGHCEYFATAATLLLRSVGVPARYSVGYSVMELDPKRKQYIIRGSHAHAWTRYWDESKNNWVDFDPTPPDWFSTENSISTQSRWLSDAYQLLKEDFFIWRNRPANRLAVTIVISSIGILLLIFVLNRLWKTRLRSDTKSARSHPYSSCASALYDLEKQAVRILGPRSLGQTYATWLSGLSKHQISAEQLEAAIQLHQSIRFDPQSSNTGYEESLKQQVEAIRSKISRL